MAMNNFGAGFVLQAFDKSTPVLKQVSGSLSEMFKTGQTGTDALNNAIGRKDLGQWMKRAGMAITGALKGMGDSAEVVERVIQNVTALKGESEATGQAMRQMIQSDAMSKLGFTADQAAMAMQTLALSGNTATSSMGALDATLQFARIGMMSTEQAASTMDAMFDVFGGTLADSQQRVDKMAWAMKQFGLGGQQVSTLMQFTASSAQLVGASFDDMLMATSMVGTVIPQTEKAAAAVNMAFQQLAAEPVQKKLGKLGVEVKDQQGNFKGLSSVLVDLMTRMQGMDKATKAMTLKDVFGARAAGGMMTIVKQLENGVAGASGEMVYGAEAAAYLSDEMQGATGMAATMAEGMVTARDAMAAAGDRVRKSLGSTVEGMLDPLRKVMANTFNKLADLLNSMPDGFKKAFIGGAAALGTFLTVAGGLLLVTTVMKQMGLTVRIMAINFVKSALMIAPFAIVLGGLAVAFYAAYKAMSRHGGPMVGIVDKLKLGWKAAMELIGGGKLSDATKKSLGTPENSGVAKFVSWFEGLLERWGKFWEGLKTGWDAGVAALGPEIDAFVAKLGDISKMFDQGDAAGQMDEWGEAGKGAGNMLASLGSIGIQVMTAMLDLLPPIVQYMKGVSSDGIVMGITGLVEGFKSVATAVTIVARAIGGLWNLIQTVGAFMGEFIGTVIDYWMTLGGIISDVLSFDFSSAFTRAKAFGERVVGTVTEGETAKQFNEMLSSLSGGEYGENKAPAMAKSSGTYEKSEKVKDMVSQYNSIAASAGGINALTDRAKNGKGTAESLERDSKIATELVSLRIAIRELAGKDLVASVEYKTVAAAASIGTSHEAGRSLAPLAPAY